jgi:hypothetical protein
MVRGVVPSSRRTNGGEPVLIGLATARQLLDFQGPNRSISEEAAEEQLRGAVAIHNILESKSVAYLADEVGMGKTYVALGAAALFRHFDPTFRLLIIAPRENIQLKWVKELRNFVRNNVRFADLRVKALHGAPARPVVVCHNLVELVRETSLNPDRDFLARLTSFSLPIGGERKSLNRYREALATHVPWAESRGLDVDLREKDAVARFKDNFARAVCAALPPFDLVIVDEGHNLKHGFGAGVATRNRVLALAFGHPTERARGFPGYGPRARRVLFLSATPIESDYAQLWNQLNVFGLAAAAPELAPDSKLLDEEKRACAQQFLIRRVTSMTVGGARLTKNLYRREWRQGGVASHDDPLEVSAVDRDRQRLIVALVQKKVSEVLGHERFKNSFQIGMLASFESFLETAKVKKPDDESEASNFDDPDQTDNLDERQGIDVGAVNSLARSYQRTFGKAMPHPKMDALVDELARALPSGHKALVFVRRVASVKELQAKLEERYDEWIFQRLRFELPGLSFEKLFDQYREERAARRRRLTAVPVPTDGDGEDEALAPLTPEDDTGGLESFFAWFFRGDGPENVLSGATMAKRFTRPRSAFSTFFEDNYVAWLLGVRPEGVLDGLARHLGLSHDDLMSALLPRAEALLPVTGNKTAGRQHLYLALQEAALGLLSEASDTVADRAKVVLQAFHGTSGARARGARAPAGSERWLEEPTFFSELRERSALRAQLWPEPASTDFRKAFREQELRRVLLSAQARLGHAFIDFYIMAIGRIGSLKARGRDDDGQDGDARDIVTAYLDLLEAQSTEGGGGFGGFKELSLASQNFDLILDTNLPELQKAALPEAGRLLGNRLGSQQPIGGMFGQINPRLVRQFRMPGYPFVLVTTDLLQEGEDLHTFCSSVHHYGISWMPSSLEQRVGRVDRVNSHAERRLTALKRAHLGDERIQVYYPHLRDTVEVLQVRRVLTRLDRFVHLMHQDLRQPDQAAKRLDLDAEMSRPSELARPSEEPMRSAFEIRPEMLQAKNRPLAVDPKVTDGLLDRFRLLRGASFKGLAITWEDNSPDDSLLGTVSLERRQQPFALLLRSFGGRVLIRCVSPVGRLDFGYDIGEVARLTARRPVQVSAIYDDRFKAYNLAVEREILLAYDSAFDVVRVQGVIEDVARAADDLEATLLERDEPMATFRSDLHLESDSGD